MGLGLKLTHCFVVIVVCDKRCYMAFRFRLQPSASSTCSAIAILLRDSDAIGEGTFNLVQGAQNRGKYCIQHFTVGLYSLVLSLINIICTTQVQLCFDGNPLDGNVRLEIILFPDSIQSTFLHLLQLFHSTVFPELQASSQTGLRHPGRVLGAPITIDVKQCHSMQSYICLRELISMAYTCIGLHRQFS